MGPPSIGSISQYHHSSSMSNDTYQMMNGYDFLSSSNHHHHHHPQGSLASSSLGTFQHSPFPSTNQTQNFNPNSAMLFNQNPEYASKHLSESSEPSVLTKPSLSPTAVTNSAAHLVTEASTYAKHHIDVATPNGWAGNQYQAQQYSLSSLCQPTNVAIDYHQPYSNSTGKYWS
jgi:hypothetical protein